VKRHPASRRSHGFLAASLAVCACISCIGAGRLSPATATDSWLDSTACDTPHLTPAELEEIAAQILAGLPARSQPPTKVLKATCVPGESSSFEIPDGPTVGIPAEDTWVFVVQGYHAPPPSWPSVFGTNYGKRNPRASGIDIGRLSKESGTGQHARPAEDLSSSATAYGYYLVSDESGRASGYGFFGPPATIVPAE
jgi:hypothetical protein